MRDARPDITPALERVVAMLCARPELGRDARSILVVGLGAHGAAAASVRALDASVARRVTLGRRARTIELGLRPAFFLDGDAPRRLTTLVHELLHIDPRAQHTGALLEANRHARRSQRALDAEAAAIARAVLTDVDPASLLCLAHDGEVLLRQWRVRPVPETSARVFADADVVHAPVVMHTPKALRGGWW